jgi:hypothetical protein
MEDNLNFKDIGKRPQFLGKTTSIVLEKWETTSILWQIGRRPHIFQIGRGPPIFQIGRRPPIFQIGRRHQIFQIGRRLQIFEIVRGLQLFLIGRWPPFQIGRRPQFVKLEDNHHFSYLKETSCFILKDNPHFSN